MVLAVLEARCGVSIGANDVYLNVAGGLRISEPAADLAVAAALVSSLADEPVPPDMVVFGEIGLGGEVRPVGQREARLREAAKLGFRSALVPKRPRRQRRRAAPPEGIVVDEIEHLADLVARFQPADRPLKRPTRGRPGTTGASNVRAKASQGSWTSSASHVFDVAVIAVAVFGAAIGMSAGFAHAVLFIVSWIGAGWIALNYSQLVEPEVLKLVQSAELAQFGSMLVVFVGALIVLVMVTNALSRAIRLSPLNKPDRILGAGFGVICAWVGHGRGLPVLHLSRPQAAAAGRRGRRDLSADPATWPISSSRYLPPGFRTRLTAEARHQPRPQPDPAARSAQDARGAQTAAVTYP